MVNDPHKVLGVTPGASQDDIKKAYRKKAKEYHPDLHPNDPEAAKKMNEINEAYDMLMNPEKYRARQEQQRRQSYHQGQQGQQGQGRGYQGTGGWYSDFGGFDFEDIFGQRQERVSINPNHEPTDTPEMSKAVDEINSGRYNDAIKTLMFIPSIQRNARWFYLNSIANYGLGNMVQAIDQMHKACEMEPNNRTYQTLLRYFRQSEQTYANNSRGYNTRVFDLKKYCCYCMALSCLCRNPYFCLFC